MHLENGARRCKVLRDAVIDDVIGQAFKCVAEVRGMGSGGGGGGTFEHDMENAHDGCFRGSRSLKKSVTIKDHS